MVGERELQALQDEIAELLAAARRSEVEHAEAMRLAEEVHRAEVEELLHDAGLVATERNAHDAELARAHQSVVAGLERALRSRDLIGRAKGVLMVTMRCTDEHAFAVMVKQSQYENRKLVDIASEIVARTERSAVPRSVD